MNRTIASALAVSVLAVAAACGGGGGHASGVTPGTGSGGTATGQVLLTIPAPATQSDARKPQYVSAGANSATIGLNGGAGTTYDLTVPSSNCVVNAGVRSCSLAITAGSGSLSVAVVLYANTTGTGTPLGSASGSTNVTPPASFTVPIQINPNVTAVTASASFPGGLPTFTYKSAGTGQLIVAFKDASNTTIPSSDNSMFLTAITFTSSNPSHIVLSASQAANAQQVVTLTYDGSSAVNSTESISIFKGTFLLATVPLRALGYLAEFAVPTTNSQPEGITVGNDGNIWFTEYAASNIGRVSLPSPLPSPYTGTPTITEYAIPSYNPSPQPFGIAAEPNNGTNLWFTESGRGQLGKISQTTPVTMETPYPNYPARGITANGNYLYIANQGSNIIDMWNPGTHVVQQSSPALGTSCDPLFIALAPDNNFWVNCAGETNLYKLNPANISLAAPVALGIPDYATDLAGGADNGLWFTEQNANAIGRVNVLSGNTITTYPITSVNAYPSGIVKGPDNAMWFSETSIDKIGRIDVTTHTITEFQLQAGAQPTKLILGPDGWIWFSETGKSAIGRIQPAA